MNSAFLSVKASAEKLKISPQRIRTLCRDGIIKSQKIGNSWIIEACSLHVYGLRTAHIAAENHGTYRCDRPSNLTAKHKPIALSFFSGAMGLDLGLEKAGFDIRLACEVDKFCRQTIALNRPETALLGDINNYQADSVLANWREAPRSTDR